jgi:hypothetical protein
MFSIDKRIVHSSMHREAIYYLEIDALFTHDRLNNTFVRQKK